MAGEAWVDNEGKMGTRKRDRIGVFLVEKEVRTRLQLVNDSASKF